MIFKRKDSFFLDLSSGEKGKADQGKPASTVQVAVRASEPSTKTPPAKTAAATPAGSTPATSQPAATSSGKPMVTTAEAIASELRAAQEARPAPSSATFAPDCLNPANAVPSPRRKAGANLAGFKAMAAEMFRS
ncbi:MAG: hypothetical protein VKM34_11375 [Cyanobacteriota bacterium]|nr:hypothetical protein [Cyanobacteriota bacterium]